MGPLGCEDGAVGSEPTKEERRMAKTEAMRKAEERQDELGMRLYALQERAGSAAEQLVRHEDTGEPVTAQPASVLGALQDVTQIIGEIVTDLARLG